MFKIDNRERVFIKIHFGKIEQENIHLFSLEYYLNQAIAF